MISSSFSFSKRSRHRWDTGRASRSQALVTFVSTNSWYGRVLFLTLVAIVGVISRLFISLNCLRETGLDIVLSSQSAHRSFSWRRCSRGHMSRLSLQLVVGLETRATMSSACCLVTSRKAGARGISMSYSWLYSRYLSRNLLKVRFWSSRARATGSNICLNPGFLSRISVGSPLYKCLILLSNIRWWVVLIYYQFIALSTLTELKSTRPAKRNVETGLWLLLVAVSFSLVLYQSWKSLFVCSPYLLRVSAVCFALYLLQLCPVTQERHSNLSINEANFWDPSLEKSTFKQITNENCTICTQQYLERITVRPYDLLRSLPIAYLCAKLDFATLERQFETVFNPSSSR